MNKLSVLLVTSSVVLISSLPVWGQEVGENHSVTPTTKSQYHLYVPSNRRYRNVLGTLRLEPYTSPRFEEIRDFDYGGSILSTGGGVTGNPPQPQPTRDYSTPDYRPYLNIPGAAR